MYYVYYVFYDKGWIVRQAGRGEWHVSSWVGGKGLRYAGRQTCRHIRDARASLEGRHILIWQTHTHTHAFTKEQSNRNIETQPACLYF